jgi:hypothetical protein
MIKQYFLAVAFLALIQVTFTSCKKLENAEPKIETPSSITNFKQIKVDPSFNWKSTRSVTFNIAPANTPVTISNTLVVKTETGTIIYKKLQKMNEDFTTYLELPSNLKKVVVTYGSIVKTIEVINNKIDFNFITETTVVE